MQRIAAWTNLSETTFVLPPTSPVGRLPAAHLHAARRAAVRRAIPTIGSAHAVLEAGVAKPNGGRLRQECGVGILELQVDGDTLWLESPPATEHRLWRILTWMFCKNH